MMPTLAMARIPSPDRSTVIRSGTFANACAGSSSPPRPVHPGHRGRALRRRWDELPEHVKHDGQALGRRTAGCEGHALACFRACDLACTPCYHSRDANRVAHRRRPQRLAEDLTGRWEHLA